MLMSWNFRRTVKPSSAIGLARHWLRSPPQSFSRNSLSPSQPKVVTTRLSPPVSLAYLVLYLDCDPEDLIEIANRRIDRQHDGGCLRRPHSLARA